MHARRSMGNASVTLPPEPRYAEILPSNDLISGAEIRQNGVVALFRLFRVRELAGKSSSASELHR